MTVYFIAFAWSFRTLHMSRNCIFMLTNSCWHTKSKSPQHHTANPLVPFLFGRPNDLSIPRFKWLIPAAERWSRFILKPLGVPRPGARSALLLPDDNAGHAPAAGRPVREPPSTAEHHLPQIQTPRIHEQKIRKFRTDKFDSEASKF